jgi:predicted CoA-substrate-specific enzyme activase
MTKVVVISDANFKAGTNAGNHTGICASIIQRTDAGHRRLANKIMEQALNQCQLRFDEITYVIATGYGRMNVPFADRQVTELTCHARGVAEQFPGVRLTIDVGGQDAKALRIKDGKLIDFVMNDKCAAGTGRFLDITATALGLKVEDLGDISARASAKAVISSTCTIFAEHEVVSCLSEGIPVENIIAGLHDSIASRVAKMARKLRVEPDVVFTGGVAKNKGVVKAMEDNLGCPILVPDEPLISGALGAALLAKDYVKQILAKNEPIKKGERRLEETTFFLQG